MHIYPSALIGVLVWVGVMLDATDHFTAFFCGPLIVSGVSLALCLLPSRTTKLVVHS